MTDIPRLISPLKKKHYGVCPEQKATVPHGHPREQTDVPQGEPKILNLETRRFKYVNFGNKFVSNVHKWSVCNICTYIWKSKTVSGKHIGKGHVNKLNWCLFCTLSSGVKIVELKHVETGHSKWTAWMLDLYLVPQSQKSSCKSMFNQVTLNGSHECWICA